MTSERLIGGVYWNSGRSRHRPRLAGRTRPRPGVDRHRQRLAADRPFDQARVGDATPLGDGGALDVDARAGQPSNGVLS
jgi:hypothetical protein